MSETNAENVLYINDSDGDSNRNVSKRQRMENGDSYQGNLGYTEIKSESYIPLGEVGEPVEHKEEDLRECVRRLDQAVKLIQETLIRQNTSLNFLHTENRIREEQTMSMQRSVYSLENSSLKYALPGIQSNQYLTPTAGHIEALLQLCNTFQTPSNKVPSPSATQSPSPIVDVVGLSSRQLTPSSSAQLAIPVSTSVAPAPLQVPDQTSSPSQTPDKSGGKITENKKRGRKSKSAASVSTSSTPSSSQRLDQTVSSSDSSNEAGQSAPKRKKSYKSDVEKLTDWIWNDKPSPKPRRQLNYKKD